MEASLASLVDELSRLRDQLEKEVAKRQRAEAALLETEHVLLTDIDARKRAEEALKGSERDLKLIIDTIPALAWSAHPDGTAEFLNQHLLDFIGLLPERVRDWDWKSAVHPDDLSALTAWHQSIMASGAPGETEARLRRRDGEYRWFLMRVNPLPDEKGSVAKWYGISTDIEDRKRAETELRQAYGRLAEAQQLSKTGSFVTDLAAHRNWSDEAYRIFEFDPATKVTVQMVRDVVHPDDRPSFDAAIARVKTGADVDYVFRVVTHRGVLKYVRTTAHIIEDIAGRPLFVGAVQDVTESKVAEAALRESERESRLIVDSIPGLVATLTPSGEVEAVNSKVLGYCGRTLEELKQWGTSDTVHPDDLARVIEVITQSMASGDPYEIEERIRHCDGLYRWFQVRGLPLRDSNGRIVRWYVLLTDIDDRKRAEAQLAGEKRLLEMVASSCPLTDVLTALCTFVEVISANCHCGVYLIDWSGPTFRNGAVPSLPATFNDTTEGLPVCLDIGPCGQAALLKQQVIVTDLETDPLWQESAIRPLALAHGLRSHWSTPIYARDGRVLGTFAIFHREPASPTQIQYDLIAQVTHIASIAIERASGEAALKRSEAFLAEAQQLSRVGSFAWRLATNELTWSEQLYRIFEFDPQVTVTLDLIGTRVHPEDLTLLHDMIDRARSAAGDFEYEHRLLMPDGSVKHLHLMAHGTTTESGEVEYIGAIQDVTQRRLAAEALDKARSELAHVTRVMSFGALTASIAHEVNQPLSGIITNASTCLRMLDVNPPNVDGARETARRTIRDGNRASDVVMRLRALFSKKELTPESLDLNEAAREVIALSSSELQRNRVVLQWELADDLPAVKGDRVQLQQVILNLLRNAADAMVAVDDRPRQLMIRTERDAGDRVRLTVKDAGEGFDSHTVDKLFEAFYTTKPSGMGIGLSVSRSIIESHHGRIWAELNDGPGATFGFAVPCAVEGRSIETNSMIERNPEASDPEHLMRTV